MQKKPYFSIVMPVYGVEKYIGRAVETIIKQSFSDWELIIVNDASKDESGSIAESFAKKEPRIKIITHTNNKGLSAARNTGLQHAQGEYVWFPDSDDYSDENLLEKVYTSLQKNRAKVVVFGLVEEYYDKNGKITLKKPISCAEQYYENKELLREEIIELEKKSLYGYAWNKVYDLSYLKEIGLEFEKITLIEDIVFNIKYFMDISKMNVLDEVPYHYCKRTDPSLTHRFVEDYYILHRKRINQLYQQHQYWNMCDTYTLAEIGALYSRYIASALMRNCDKQSGMKNTDRHQFCVRLFKDSLFRKLVLNTKIISKNKTQIIMMRILKTKNVALVLGLGRIIYITKTGLPGLFTRLRIKR
jgi:glycosyltransferase involved in cell wall biosynthesis